MADLGPNLLANPSFDDGFAAPWRLTTSEVGAGGHLTIDRGALLFQASGISKNGTIHAMQQVAKPDDGALVVSYRAMTEGRDAMGAAVILRERTSTGQTADTTFSHALTRTMQTYEWTLRPKLTGGDVQVYVRLRAAVGLEQSARVDDVELRTGPEVAWTVDGGRVASQGGLAARVVFEQLGAHRVLAEGMRFGRSQWKVERSVVVENAPPLAALAPVPMTPPLGAPLLLNAGLATDADSALRLTDPRFDLLGSAWVVSAKEVGGNVEAARRTDGLGRPVLDLDVAASANGTVHASHSIPIANARSAAFTVGIRDNGGVQHYEFILRERNATGNSTDTRYRFASTDGEERLASMVWTPKSTDPVTLQVFLRFRILKGSSAEVSFIQPALQSGLTYSYWLDDVPLGTTANATWPVILQDLDDHVARVEVKDAEGATSNATIPLRANDAGFLWDIRGPRVVPLGPAVGLDAGGTSRPDGLLNDVANADFEAGKEGWRLGRGETGGEVAWDVLHDPEGAFSRIAVQGKTAGSSYISQDVGLRCVKIECRFSFQSRLVAGEAILEPILRATVQPPGESSRTVDVRLTQGMGATWTYNETAWAPPTEDVVRLQVFLRFRTPANGSATVDFRDVRLGPERSFTWTVEGPSGRHEYRGPLIRPGFTEPGLHSVGVALETDLGLGIPFRSTDSTTVDVLPASFFATQDGLALRIHAARGNATVSVLGADGTVSWSRPVDKALQGDPAREYVDAGEPRILLPGLGPADRVSLFNGTAWGNVSAQDLAARLPAPFGPVGIATKHAGWTTRLHVKAPVADPSIQRATLVVRSGGAVLDETVVEPGPEGVDVLLDLPAGWRTRDLVVSIATEDGWGRTFEERAFAESGRNPVLLPSVLAIGVAAALVLFGVAVRLAQGRRP